MSHIPFSFPGFQIQQVTSIKGQLLITATATNDIAVGPHVARAAVVSIAGINVLLMICQAVAKKSNSTCTSEDSAAETMRLIVLLKLFAIAVNAQEGSRLLVHLAIPISDDTLLRIVKQNPVPIIATPRGNFELLRQRFLNAS
ncbi:hypothetical protein [Ktedonospora formicarum]|uniref:hypothetical protein n=1 Tax=Ktedonospora formicarum TaxID=2778364 RepID=UPI001C690878|nr:hypothetical protein [Ktedonospora formicarum]